LVDCCRLLLEEVTAEIKAAEEQLAADDALKLALPVEDASKLEANQEVRMLSDCYLSKSCVASVFL
jgi:hypothetical protein